MDTLAWVGVTILGIAGVVWLIILLIAWLFDPVGRWILLALTLTILALWGAIGGIYLIIKAA